VRRRDVQGSRLAGPSGGENGDLDIDGELEIRVDEALRRADQCLGVESKLIPPEVTEVAIRVSKGLLDVMVAGATGEF